jgi:hypothetical protein
VLFHVQMTVNLPHDLEADRVELLKAATSFPVHGRGGGGAMPPSLRTCYGSAKDPRRSRVSTTELKDING